VFVQIPAFAATNSPTLCDDRAPCGAAGQQEGVQWVMWLLVTC